MTLFIIIVTIAVSVLSFNNYELFSKLQLNTYQVYHRRQWYRLISHGFVHADWVHLGVNMFVLYSFGSGIERIFQQLEAEGFLRFYQFWFIGFYLTAIIMASLMSVAKYRDNYSYNSVGASGAVSAVVFFYIFFAPYSQLLLFMVIPIPGILYGIAYLIYSQYMSRKGSDNINHDAHFIGAVYGLIFPLIIDMKLINHFINQISTFNFFN